MTKWYTLEIIIISIGDFAIGYSICEMCYCGGEGV